VYLQQVIIADVVGVSHCQAWAKTASTDARRPTDSALRHRSDAIDFRSVPVSCGGSVAEWLACWTQAQKGAGSIRSRDAVG